MICLTDSSAAKGIESRKGVGKVKHLSLKELWVQDAIEQTRFKVQKVGTDSTWADLGTKVLDGSRILQLLKLLRLKGGAVIASVVTLQQLKDGMNRRDSASLFLAVFPYCSFVSFVCFHQSRFEHGQLDEAEERANTFNVRNGRRRRSRIGNDKLA